MKRVTVAIIMISLATGIAGSSEISLPGAHVVSKIYEKSCDLILTSDGEKVIGCLEGVPTIQFSFGEIAFPKTEIAMILQDPHNREKIHVVTTSGHSYSGTLVKDSFTTFVNKEKTSVNEVSAILPEEKKGSFHFDSKPLYSIRFNNGDRLTAFIYDKEIRLSDGYEIFSITPSQVVKLSNSEGIYFENEGTTQRKFSSHVIDQYLSLVIPARDELVKIRWDLIEKVEKYDPIYDEETFETVATVLQPLYENVNKEMLFAKGVKEKSSVNLGYIPGQTEDSSLQIADSPTEELPAIIVVKNPGLATESALIPEVKDLFNEETRICQIGLCKGDLEEVAYVDVNDLGKAVVASCNPQSERLFDEGMGFAIPEHLTVTEYSSKPEPLFDEESDFSLPSNLAVKEFSKEKEPLFDEKVGFSVPENIAFIEKPEKEIVIAKDDAFHAHPQKIALLELMKLFVDREEKWKCPEHLLALNESIPRKRVISKQLIAELQELLSSDKEIQPNDQVEENFSFYFPSEEMVIVQGDLEEPSFEIGAQLVSNQEFYYFTLETGHYEWIQWNPDEGPIEKAETPVLGLSKEAAKEYVSWRGKRLPTSEELKSAVEAGAIDKDPAIAEWAFDSNDESQKQKGFRVASAQ